ncbi:unnamed protein product [Mytilus edulis]|uniref:Farnesoic acid O-methyl transferase domain-containing protein n=1 Tax=Mytilus edulis TaxID=6550 RepID=A0A8S3QPD4_MYTED|nr:unnamed protein product [Mytilus edulis]
MSVSVYVNVYLFQTDNYMITGALQDILREVHVHTPNTDESIQIDPNAPELSHPLNQYGFIASEKSSIDFELKVCHDAFIYLSASLVMDSTADVYEIVMGGGSGTKVFLRSKNGVDVAQGLLGTSNTDCDQFVPFWISWENGNVKIGKGLIINQDVVIDWTDSDPFIIAGIGVRSGYGSSGQWIFHVEASGEFCVTGGTRGTMNILTTDIVRERKWRERILLRRNDATFQDVAVNELGDGSTQCGSFQPIWISWQNGNIKIGKGLSIDSKVVIDWRDPNPFIIHGVGVRTGLGQSGQWIIYMEGKNTHKK